MAQENIRNFCIIAHIDHGKSTLADRILELTNAVSQREMKSQLLDNMDLERERGITIKLKAIKLDYEYNNQKYLLNLIDTPGHVDFSYEVSRSLDACEGAILVVDAAQGIEAQTLANLYLALNSDLTLIPVINKIDLPNADIPKVKKELVDVLGFNESEIILCSGKTGEGVKELVEAVINRVKPPKIANESPLRALIFDSYFDPYNGVVGMIKIVDGRLKVGDKIKMMATDASYEVLELGVHTPKPIKKDTLICGEVGYFSASIKEIGSIKVGDTVTLFDNPAKEKLPGYKEVMPMVFSGIYPIDGNKYNQLKEALEKLKLNDASLTFEMESSGALGFGFRCGFLGLLHMEIITERIRREYNIEIIATSPSVIYEVKLTNGEIIKVDSPNKLPDRTQISSIKEPFIRTNIYVPAEYIGAVLELCEEKRGVYDSVEYLDPTRANIHYYLPLNEIVYDFFNKLKSSTKGYASFDYDLADYQESKLIKMDILINGEKVDVLSVIVHESLAYKRGKVIVEALKEIIPRQQFQVPIQAAIGSKIIARETISAIRKNVLAKCYGGDVSRKRKLLEKQKEGKKKMKMIGKVEIPGDAFLSILKSDNN
ncbi:MAG: elongation factor 4 [Mollicutes bacterium]|nr:elongation factor 4 [Mollicutes bacterium]